MRILNILKGFWRLLQPFKFYFLRHPLQIWVSYTRFFKDLIAYNLMSGKIQFRYIFPSLSFKGEDVQSGGSHYFYQDVWAMKKLAALRPEMHFDIGSRYDGFVGQATAICPVTSIDIRQPGFILPDLHYLSGDILKLPFPDGSLSTLSCLHTIEHVGLGRYGDGLNPEGYDLALLEIQRVLMPGGFLLLSMPVGVHRVEFNSQRVLNPLDCINKLTDMSLKEFSIITDSGDFIECADPSGFTDQNSACGLYYFEKKNDKDSDDV